MGHGATEDPWSLRLHYYYRDLTGPESSCLRTEKKSLGATQGRIGTGSDKLDAAWVSYSDSVEDSTISTPEIRRPNEKTQSETDHCVEQSR